jgi:hypothetical protein
MANLASLPVMFTCLAQERGLREEFMAERRKRNLDDGNWDAMLVETPWAACVRRKKWISEAYCTDLYEANAKGSRRDVAGVMEKHRTEYQGLKPMVDYFEAAFPKSGVEASTLVPCPE